MKKLAVSLCSTSGLILALYAAHAMAGDKLSYGPASDWVKPVDLPKPNPALNDTAIQVLLNNVQLRFESDGQSTYNEVALRLQTPQALQAAQSAVAWNPDTDTVTVNKATIIRDGKTIDLLKTQTFTIVRRETNIELSMLDGMLTGVLQPEGLQVGDIVDYAFTIHRSDPIYAQRAESVVNVGMAQPAGKTVIRASWDANRPIIFQQSADLPKAILTKTPAANVFLIETTGYKPPQPPASAPDRFNQNGYAQFSEFASWRDVSRLLAPLYDKASALSADSPLHAEVAKIRAASSDPAVQAAMALKLVETNIRYVFLGMNQGGYIPAGADTTWQRRFGDCKGKTALLLSLLRELGITADAAAVSTTAGDGLDSHLPGLQLFDHVIVRTEISGHVYWLDATRLGDRGLDTLAVPPYHWALPLRDTGADLEALKVKPFDKPESETFIKLDATLGWGVPSRAHLEQILRYDSAISGNLGIQSVAATEREKALKKYWTDKYSWLTPKRVSSHYDESAGELHVLAYGDATMQWDSDEKTGRMKYTTDEMPIGWGEGLSRETGPNKTVPMSINFPNYYVTHEEIRLPNNGKGFAFSGTSLDKTIAGTEFHRALSLKGNVFTLEASKRSLTPEIPYAEATKASDELVAMWKENIYLLAPSVPNSAPAAVPATADAPPVSADDFTKRGYSELGKSGGDLALKDFNSALQLDPANTNALIGRGTAFMIRGKYEAGLADCQQAVKADPSSWGAYNCIGQAYMGLYKLQDAVDAYTKAIEIYPNNLWALQARAFAFQGLGDKTKAKADAESALDLDPSAVWATTTLTQLALSDNKPDDAMALVDKALAGNPDDKLLIHLKIAVLESCQGLSAEACATRKAGAVSWYDKLIAANPDDTEDMALRAQDRLPSDRQAAMNDLDAAIKIAPQSAIPNLVRAAIYLRDKDDQKALTAVDAALAVEPGNAQGLNIRSGIYFRLKRDAEAFADIDAEVAKFPTNGSALNRACWARATHNYDLAKALELCNAAVKASPEEAAFLDSRAFVKLRLGQYDDAIADYDNALAKQPVLGPSLYGRGLAKLKKGMKAEGNKDLAAARKIYPKVDDEFKGYGVTP